MRSYHWSGDSEGGSVKVYLVQHGKAMSEEQDPERPLTDLGRQETAWVADVAARLGLEVGQIRHSGRLRAEQTAEILGEALEPADGVVPAPGMSPLDNVEPAAEDLEAASEPMMLVGHLPYVERLAGRLLTGNAGQIVVDFANSGIVCLERKVERWQVVWIITPEIAELKSAV